jgi:hypothetical protein
MSSRNAVGYPPPSAVFPSSSVNGRIGGHQYAFRTPAHCLNCAETGPLGRGWREGELRTLPVIRLRQRDQQGSTHIPSARSASSTDAFPRKVNGLLTRFTILCARKASAESPLWLHLKSRQ